MFDISALISNKTNRRLNGATESADFQSHRTAMNSLRIQRISELNSFCWFEFPSTGSNWFIRLDRDWMNELANALAASPHSSTPGSRRHWTNQPRQTKQNQNSPIANNYEERSTPSNRHAIFQHHKRRNEFPQIHTRRSYPVSSQWNSIGGRGKGGEGGEALASADDFNTMPAAYNPPPIFRNRSGNDHQYE